MLMSIAWLLMFIYFAYSAFARPAWGVALYMLAFFAFPLSWWWGKQEFLGDITSRWNLIAALIFVAAVFTNDRFGLLEKDRKARTVFYLLLLYAINATLVHLFFANEPIRSYNNLQLLWKQIGLALLIYLCIANPADLKLVLMSIFIGSWYVAYEVVWNKRGKIIQGRLEGIIIPGAEHSNHLAGLMCLALVLGGGLLFVGSRRDKLASFLSLPFVFDVILRCTSRAAFLALLAGGFRLYLASTGRMRRFANVAVVLALLAVGLQAKDPKIIERFSTTFVSEEERDKSAQSRIDYTIAGLKMVAQHPLGSGGEAAFKSDLGATYIRHLGIEKYRAVHNGYVDIAAGWGVQGFVIYISALFMAWKYMHQAVRYRSKIGQSKVAFVGVIIESALITQLVVCGFNSTLDGEWFLWLVGIMLGYGRLHAPPPDSSSPVDRRVEQRYTGSRPHDTEDEAYNPYGELASMHGT